MANSADRCFHALASVRHVLPAAVLDQALREAEARGRPLERHLVETNALSRDLARDLEVARSALARACAACRKVTYLLPGASEAKTPCEHCGGVLAPHPRSGAHAAPARTSPRSAARPEPRPEPRPERRPEPATPARAPALLDDDDDDGPPLPPRIGLARIEGVLAEDERVVVYAGRIDDVRVAVRALRPERAARRRLVDRFFCQAQAAAPAGLAPLDVGVDALGAPFLTVRRPDDMELGPLLLGLDVLDASGEGDVSRSDTSSGIFAKLNRQRQQLLKDVDACSRRRERCVGRYVLLERLAVDAGELWRGYDSDRQEVVAVRVMAAGPALSDGRLRREVDEHLAAATRLRHEHLVPPRDHGVDGGRLFLVREHVVGTPLGPGAPLERVVAQVQQAARALAYAHGMNVVHGALHPGNVTVRADRSVNLLDLGVACAAAAAGAVTPVWRVMRAGCAAPESPPAGPDGLAGDLHALGAILYRAAAPHLPEEPPAPGGEPDARGDVLAIVLRCVAADPADRYASALDLARDLDRVLQGQVPAARDLVARKVAPPQPSTTPSSVVGTLSGVFKKWLGR